MVQSYDGHSAFNCRIRVSIRYVTRSEGSPELRRSNLMTGLRASYHPWSCETAATDRNSMTRQISDFHHAVTWSYRGVFIPPNSSSRIWSSSGESAMVRYFRQSSLWSPWVYSGYIVAHRPIDHCPRFPFASIFVMSCCICLEDLNSPVSLPCGMSAMVYFRISIRW